MGLFGGIKKSKRQWDDFRRMGEGMYGSGTADTKAALGGLDNLDSRLTGTIDRGGLTPEMEAVFNRGEGAITDDAQRARLGYQTTAEQMLRRSGGSLDPNVALDMGVENDANIQENTFTARNNLADSEAKLRMDNTNALLDKLFAVRDRKLGAAQSEQTQGLQAWQAAIGGKVNTMLGFANLATSLLGVAKGGSGGGH